MVLTPAPGKLPVAGVPHVTGPVRPGEPGDDVTVPVDGQGGDGCRPRGARDRYVVREPDPADRRRVTVVLTAAAEQRVERVYGPVADAGAAELRRRTAADLEVIIDFLERGNSLQLEQAARIRALG